MIEKFDLTRFIDMSGNMNNKDFEEAQRLRDLINDNPHNLEYHFQRARFFARLDDDTYTVINYCRIIQDFNNNIIAYEELAQYLYYASYYDWAIATTVEGLKYDYHNKKLQNILTLSCKALTD